MAVMKDKRHYLSACTINDEFIYAFGGFFGSTEQEINDTIEVFEVEKNIWSVLTVRMKVSNHFLTFTESSLGMQRLGCVSDGDYSNWRQEHEQKWRSSSIQRNQQDLEVSALDEPAARFAQEFLLPEQDLCDRR